jgi:phosphatidylserine decarboxylase
MLRLLPQHWLSARMYDLTRNETRWLKDTLIRYAVSHYDVDMGEAAIEDPLAYPSFNAFFTRALKPEARPIDPDAVVSPADGKILQAGPIHVDRLVQAKGHEFSLYALLAGDSFAASQFESGSFATVYLSPRDYHRVHIPLAGTLREMTFVPGDLFSVSEATTQLVPGLFARNERLILMFDTERGPMAVILVGAIFVGSMQTVWHGEVKADQVRHWQYPKESAPHFAKGEEIARFNMGSTVIVLHPQYAVDMREQLIGRPVRLGQPIGD